MSRQLQIKVKGSKSQILSLTEHLKEFYEVVPTSEILQPYGETEAHQYLTLVEVSN